MGPQLDEERPIADESLQITGSPDRFYLVGKLRKGNQAVPPAHKDMISFAKMDMMQTYLNRRRKQDRGWCFYKYISFTNLRRWASPFVP